MSGLIWYSTPRATVGLVVNDQGIVVDCPPYARRWALGQDARRLWREAFGRPGYQLQWLPDQPTPA